MPSEVAMLIQHIVEWINETICRIDIEINLYDGIG